MRKKKHAGTCRLCLSLTLACLPQGQEKGGRYAGRSAMQPDLRCCRQPSGACCQYCDTTCVVIFVIIRSQPPAEVFETRSIACVESIGAEVVAWSVPWIRVPEPTALTAEARACASFVVASGPPRNSGIEVARACASSGWLWREGRRQLGVDRTVPLSIQQRQVL